MKNLIFLAIALLVPGLSIAQIISLLPTDENGNLAFSSVEEVEGSADQLYSRAKQFFVDSYKSADDVIQLEDNENRLIVGKAFNDIQITNLGKVFDVQLWYTVKIQSKEGRYKYDIYDIYYQTYPSINYGSQTYPPEHFFDESAYYRKNGRPKKIPDQYKIQTVVSTSGLAKMITAAMAKNTTSADSW